MGTIYFSNGEVAKVKDVHGYNPRTFTIPATSYKTLLKAWQEQSTAWFSENGEIYFLARLQKDRGTAVLKSSENPDQTL